MGLIELGAVWVAAAVLCLAAGAARGRPARALAFGLLFGPAALAVVAPDLAEHRRRARGAGARRGRPQVAEPGAAADTRRPSGSH